MRQSKYLPKKKTEILLVHYLSLPSYPEKPKGSPDNDKLYSVWIKLMVNLEI